MSENENERKVSDTKAKMMMFEKASKVKVPTDEEQRKKAKFNAKLGRFEAAAAATNNGTGAAPSQQQLPLERKTSEVLGKAKYFVDVAAAGAAEDEKKKQEEIETAARKESFTKMKAGFEGGDATAATAGFNSYDEYKEDEERRLKEEEAERAEEERRKREEFKNKQSMFASS